MSFYVRRDENDNIIFCALPYVTAAAWTSAALMYSVRKCDTTCLYCKSINSGSPCRNCGATEKE